MVAFLALHKHPHIHTHTHTHTHTHKTRIIYKIFETKYIDTSFQVTNRTEI